MNSYYERHGNRTPLLGPISPNHWESHVWVELSNPHMSGEQLARLLP